MRTITLRTPGHFAPIDLPEPPAPGPGEARVAVRRVGICGTDLHAFRGRQPFFDYPRILGHELGVTVLDVGPDVEGLSPGDACAVEPYLNCGDCVACRRGKSNCCVALKTLGVHTDGGMRERIVLPAAKLHRSDRLTLDQLALVETLGIGRHAVNRAAVEPGEWVLVLGGGPIGLAVLQFAKADGARLIVADLNPDRLAFCRALGVEQALDAGDRLADRLAEITGGEGPTVVFDATGNAASMNGAPGLVAHGGRLVYVGLIQGDLTLSDPLLHRRELTLLATRNSTSREFREVLSLVEERTIDTGPWITHRAPFDRMIDAFPTWLDPASRTVKAVVEIA